MRELKFRIFCVEEKKCLPVEMIDFTNHEISYVCDCGGIHWRSTKDFSLLMQFVGFLDKNGNPIFEGDIVADEYGDDEMQGIITYDAKSAKYIRKSLNTTPEQDDFMDDLHEPRIIGNIYENSELLNK